MGGGNVRGIKRHLQRYKPYVLAREIKWAVERAFEPQSDDLKTATLGPQRESRGNVLISYIIDPFLARDEQAVSTAHTHDWESLQMAKTFVELGYSVDMISYKNLQFRPERPYDVFVDARYNMERLGPLMPSQCVKIMHVDVAHMLYHDAAEARRLLELQQRRGVTLRPRRWEPPNLAIENADCATVLGNEFTINTFRYAKKPLHRVPISTTATYGWPENKDFSACRRNYLWFGSGGMVHKGLDLVLEAFAEMPDYRLTICGPVQTEEDFATAFSKELFETPNIHLAGWVDVTSQQFVEICHKCVGIIYPSCSEGGGGSVISCMHAGLIPIVSYESSVDVGPDYGVLLESSSVSEIRRAIGRVSNLPVEELRSMARGAWEFARKNHTRERFAEEYKRVVKGILNEPDRRPVQTQQVGPTADGSSFHW